jgi:CBS domain-containing protein
MRAAVMASLVSRFNQEAAMTVQQIMSTPVLTCEPDTLVSLAARRMRDGNCGTLPVIGTDGRLVGIVTDRDICLGFAESRRNAAHVAVHEIMTRKPVAILVHDTIHEALATMKHAHVRRLPVVDSFGRLQGLVSIEDVIVRGLESGGVGTDEIVLALRTIYERRPVEIATETTS